MTTKPENAMVEVAQGWRAGLVSVIIPTYNHAAYITDAIQSVLCQTYPLVEVIVVDDGSKDNTADVVAQTGASVQYIYQENRGLSAARNTGLRAARGEFVGVLDADDMYEPDFLDRMTAALRSDAGAAAAYCGFRFVDSRNHHLPQVGVRVVPPEAFYAALLDGNFLVPECILVRAACYRQVGFFDENLRACEDWDMWLRIARDFRVTGSGEILIRHRTLPGSMSSDPQRMLVARLAVLRKVFGMPAGESLEKDITRWKAHGRAFLATALEYLQHGQQAKAYDCLRAAVREWPGLLGEFDLYYELGCGAQPKGARGDFASLDLSQSAALLLSFLESLFSDRELDRFIRPYHSKAFAAAHLALGQLSYGARNPALARDHLVKAVRHRPIYLFKRQVTPIFVKTLLGPRIVADLRRRAHKAS